MGAHALTQSLTHVHTRSLTHAHVCMRAHSDSLARARKHACAQVALARKRADAHVAALALALALALTSPHLTSLHLTSPHCTHALTDSVALVAIAVSHAGTESAVGVSAANLRPHEARPSAVAMYERLCRAVVRGPRPESAVFRKQVRHRRGKPA